MPGLIEDDPMNDLYKQHQPEIPLLTGITKDETKKVIHGKYREEILNKLRHVPEFLNNVLVKNLQEFVAIHRLRRSKASEKFLQLLNVSEFRNYIHAKANDYKEGLMRVAEATGINNINDFIKIYL